MVEVVLSVAAKLAEYLVDPTLQQVKYLLCVGKITRNVETRKEELLSQKRRVQKIENGAINKIHRIDDEVMKWKNEVENLITEVENMEKELRANYGCFQSWFPTWKRYCLCRKLAKRTLRMIKLNAKCDQLNPFSHPITIPDIEYHSIKDFEYFKSTKEASDQLKEALQNDGIFIVGLFGMGGSGKTTLVTKVGKEAKESKFFDRVVLTTVSQSPDIRKIQGEIIDLLGLTVHQETEIGRARSIAQKLQSGERILIILDDVWAKLNLEDIGIPLEANHRGTCKVLLTTRIKDVCTLMDCQTTIPLDLLTEDEAWNLFQKHAKVDDGDKEVVAREIAEKCKRLPIAIVAIGRCLRGKGLDEMNEVLHKLRHSKPISTDEGERNAFACLELSYNYLKTPEAKLLFLMCATFPEDHKIIIEDILRYGVGLGLCKDADSLGIARNQVRAAVNILIDSSLLMYSKYYSGQEFFTMHDLVRRVALWIASKEDRTIMVDPTKKLNELLENDFTKDCYAVSSWDNKKELHQFPCQLYAPKLEILLLSLRNSLDLSDASFDGIKGLKVMAIINNSLSNSLMELFPQSIQWLSNLRTLRLQGWELGDISFVLSLTRLEILDLQNSKFNELPNGIEKLNKLKLLDLSRCKTKECCYKDIASCSQLEELYVSGSSPSGGKPYCHECLMGLAVFPKLRRYKLEMGQTKHPLKFSNVCTRALYLGQLNISTTSATIKDLAQRAIGIQFFELQGGCKSFIPDMIQAIGGMSKLTKLELVQCSEIECLTNKTASHEEVVVPNLVELVLRSMDNLKQLCCGPPLTSLFHNLERLKISHCPQLQSMFPAKCSLGNLKKLTILDCPKLTSLFPVSVSCTLLSLSQLKIRNCDELKYVIREEGGVEEQSIDNQNESQIVFPLLEHLVLENLPILLGICSKTYHLSWSSMNIVCCVNCPNLSTLCGSLMVGSELRHPLPNMEMHALSDHQLSNEESKPLAAVSPIESIDLDNCGVAYIFQHQTGVEVQNPTISNGSNLIVQIPRFKYLRSVTLFNCAKLKLVFPTAVCQNLPELSTVDISNCEELEEIFEVNEEITQKNLSNAQVCFPKLDRLSIDECNKLRIIFPTTIAMATSMLPELESLSISNSVQLEEIVRCTNFEDHVTDNEKQIMFPNLKFITLMELPRLANFSQRVMWQAVEFVEMLVYECPKFVPIPGISTRSYPEEHVRKYALKWSQLSNNEALTLPLPIQNSWALGIQVIGDDDQQEAAMDTEMLGSEHQILKGLIPTQLVSFQYLRTLEVIQCPKLKLLFSMSTIVHNSLPNLTSLSLFDCEELEEIVGDKEEPQNISDAQVCFPELRELRVERCNKLKRLFSATMATMLPQLTTLHINTAAQLEEIVGDKEEPQNISDAQVCFPKLRELKVKRCNKLKRLFFMSMVIMLPQLESLCVIEAAQLEEIFGHKSERQEEEQHFPELVHLSVCRCSKLKCIFSLPSNCDLAQLEYLNVRGCSQLEQVFSCKHEIHDEGLNKNVFPELKILELEGLPNLTDICEGFPSPLQYPSIWDFSVEGCPIFSKTTLAALNNSLTRRRGCPIFSRTTLASLNNSLNRRRGRNPDDKQENEESYDSDDSYACDNDDDESKEVRWRQLLFLDGRDDD